MSGKMTVMMDVVAPAVSAGERILREAKEKLFAQEALWVVRLDVSYEAVELGKENENCGNRKIILDKVEV